MGNIPLLWLQLMLDLIGQGVFLCGLASNFISAAWRTGENSNKLFHYFRKAATCSESRSSQWNKNLSQSRETLFFCVFIDNQSTRMPFLSRSLVSKFWEAVVSYIFCTKYAWRPNVACKVAVAWVVPPDDWEHRRKELNHKANKCRFSQ